MRTLWRRIEAWFAEHLPDAPLRLRPAATEAQIATAEARLGVRFPDDYRASLAIHDGQDDEPGVWWLAGVQRLGPLASLVDCWERDRPHWDPDDPEGRAGWLDRSERVRQVHFHPRQIPIAGSTHWDYDRLLLDFVPGPAGSDGQVILRDDIYLEPIAATFRELLEKTLAGLERGTIAPGDREEDMIVMAYLSPRAKKRLSVAKYFR